MPGILELVWKSAPHWAHVAVGISAIAPFVLGAAFYSLRYCNGICDQVSQLRSRRPKHAPRKGSIHASRYRVKK
jgi:hypothetical protein